MPKRKITNDPWIEDREASIKEIEEIIGEKHDRLDVFINLGVVHAIVKESVKGWNQWLANPCLMGSADEELARELLVKYCNVALDYLKLDIEATTKITDSMKTNDKYLLPEKPKKQDKSNPDRIGMLPGYVA